MTGNPGVVTRSQPVQPAATVAAARQSRDRGLRRVRRITWQVGLLSAAAAAGIGATFAPASTTAKHVTSSASGTSSSSGLSSSSGVSSSAGSATSTSGSS